MNINHNCNTSSGNNNSSIDDNADINNDNNITIARRIRKGFWGFMLYYSYMGTIREYVLL